MGVSINIGDTWKEVAGASINIGDVWKNIASTGSINIGDVWKQFSFGISTVNPQMLFFENIPGREGTTMSNYSNATWSFQEINIPMSLSFNYPGILISHNSTSKTATSFNYSFSMGLYSFDGTSLILANSASKNYVNNASKTAISWISMVTSATQNITPGSWYLGFGLQSGGNSSISLLYGHTINPQNASPVFVGGRMTESTNAPPASIATSDLDITGSDALTQPYIIITS